MIVPMKKVYILLRKEWTEEAIARLGDAGLLHVSHVKRPGGEALLELRRKQAVIEKVFIQLEGCPQTEMEVHAEIEAPVSIPDAAALCNRYMELSEESKTLGERLAGLEDEYRKAALWGDFDRGDIASLEKSGLELRLFACPGNRIEEMPEGVAYSVIARDGDISFVAAVTGNDAPDIPFSSIALPERSASMVKAEMDGIYERMSAIGKDRAAICGRKDDISAALEALEVEISFERVRRGMGEDEGVAYISGFVPGRDAERIKELAAENRWGFIEADPEPGDEVPTLLEHSRLTALFQPVMNFIGVMPGYFEFDTNGIFLIFFSLFFAMIVGDAGYGLIILAGSLLAGRFFPSLPKETGRLFVTLSLTTLLWGSVTGNWFGIDVLNVPVIGNLVLPGLSSFDPANGAVVMEICFFLALMHLSAAHLWKGLIYLPSLKAVSEAGWVMLLAGIYMIVRYLTLKAAFPEASPFLIAAGFSLVLLFSGQKGDGFIKGLKRGSSQLPVFLLDGIGGLSNIVSYLRLFAVGMASREVALAFNSIAGGVGFDGPISAAAAIFIMVSGHLVNMLLIAMSVVVHGIRLNILEFSGHMHIEWSGISYMPFGREDSVKRLHSNSDRI